MNLKLGVDRVYAEMDEDYEDCVPDMSLEAAIDVIQRNERGRQGKQRARLVKHVREEEKRQRCEHAVMGFSFMLRKCTHMHTYKQVATNCIAII